MVHFETGRRLSDFSTFGIGGEARLLAEIKSVEQMQEALGYCHLHRIPFLVVGKGSNALFHDQGFEGAVLINKIQSCVFEEKRVRVGAGYSFALLGVQTARRSLSGLEFASGIPGSVGGAIFMNAGASGSQTSDVLIEVEFVTETGELKCFPRSEIVFSYRHSSFQQMKGAIVRATFELTDSREARAKQLEIIDYRTRTQPYGDKSCGCVFRNPEGHSAGRLIEQCGLKGMKRGGAEVSLLHSNFIINPGSATASDVVELAREIRAVVKEKTGIELEMELCVIPFRLSS